MRNSKRPAFPVVYEHDDASSEQPGLTKEEYARIELAKALAATDGVHLNDVARLARHMAKELFIDDDEAGA